MQYNPPFRSPNPESFDFQNNRQNSCYRVLVAFDLDKTLLASNSSYAFSKYLYKKRVISLNQLLYCLLYRFQHHFFSLSLEAFHRKVFDKLLLGMSLKSLQKHVSIFLKTFLPSAFNEKVLLKLFEAQKKGDYTALLSNAPDFIVGPIAKLLQVNDWACTQYIVDKDKRLCKIAKLMEGKNKAAYLSHLSRRLHLSKEAIVAYSDSYHDLPFLLEAGVPIAVNPDRRLLKIAREHKWRVM